MRIKSKFFGEIDINKDSVYTFKNGIPGFNHLHRFALISEEDSPYCYLQSLDEEYICFVVLNSFFIIPDYDVELDEATVKELDIKKQEDVILYSILTIPEDIRAMTANMQAPLVLNSSNKTGMQHILDHDRYSRKHKLIKE